KPIVYVYRIKIYSSANKPEIEDYKATLEGIPNMYVRKYSGKYHLYSGNYKTEAKAQSVNLMIIDYLGEGGTISKIKK
ncbi:SPOR domain-containing protein, partial [bacterium]|nr:SPOR domain-containing protein [bacterium]